MWTSIFLYKLHMYLYILSSFPVRHLVHTRVNIEKKAILFTRSFAHGTSLKSPIFAFIFVSFYTHTYTVTDPTNCTENTFDK